MEYWVSSYDPSSSSGLGSGGSRDDKKGGAGRRRWGGGGGGKGVKLSTDAQSVAARERRHRISERFKILQSLVPGGSKMDTVSMLEEAIHYVKFLKAQIWLHQTLINSSSTSVCGTNVNINASRTSNCDPCSSSPSTFLLPTPSSAAAAAPQVMMNNNIMVGHDEEAQAQECEDYSLPVDADLLDSYFPVFD